MAEDSLRGVRHGVKLTLFSLADFAALALLLSLPRSLLLLGLLLGIGYAGYRAYRGPRRALDVRVHGALVPDREFELQMSKLEAEESALDAKISRLEADG